MTADDLHKYLVARCRAIDDELRGREALLQKAHVEHDNAIDLLRRQYDAFALLMPIIDDAMGTYLRKTDGG